MKFDLPLPIYEGQTLRYNCPYCGGNNTFSISRKNGKIVWHCFRASCHTAGSFSVDRSIEDIKSTLHTETQNIKFSIPDYFCNVLSNERALSYLKRNNCLDAYVNKLADIKYDPKQDRVVFMIYDKNELVDAAGRALKSDIKPKWFRYGKSTTPFTAGDTDICVVVEDCASACSVAASGFMGFAILGTHFPVSHISRLLNKRVLIALDKDATRIALRIQKTLSFYVGASVVPLEEDLKYLNPLEVRAHIEPFLTK